MKLLLFSFKIASSSTNLQFSMSNICYNYSILNLDTSEESFVISI